MYMQRVRKKKNLNLLKKKIDIYSFLLHYKDINLKKVY